MSEQLQNGPGSATLNGALNSSATSVPVSAVSGNLPASGTYSINVFKLTGSTVSQFETMRVLSVSSNTLTVATRSAGVAHDDASIVEYTVDTLSIQQLIVDLGSAAICQGRLTLTSGVPVTTSDVTAAGTLYFTPYIGNRIATYSGSAWSVSSFAEKSLSLSLTSGKNYDVFIVSGTLALELSAAWTNDTTRADALALQDGIYVKSSDHTRRYLGTIRASGTNTTEDSDTKRFVWNLYNQSERQLWRQDSTANWNYSTDSWRQANAASANQVEIVTGISAALSLRLIANVAVPANADASAAIGEDSTSAPDSRCFNHNSSVESGGRSFTGVSSVLQKIPSLGYHYYAWLERADTATTTWTGVSGPYANSGICGTMIG